MRQEVQSHIGAYAECAIGLLNTILGTTGVPGGHAVITYIDEILCNVDYCTVVDNQSLPILLWLNGW